MTQMYANNFSKNKNSCAFASFDDLNEAKIRARLRTKNLGWRVAVVQETASTQLEFAARGWESGPEGSVVLAETQTAGRGRLGRRFYAPPGNGVYMSVLLKPDLPPERMVFVTVCAAVAVCRALRVATGLDAGIKWVNDIFHNGKKLCGILAEASPDMTRVILGIGVNTGVVPSEVADIATSVGVETGAAVDRNALAAEILNELEPLYARLADDAARREVLREYAERQILTGRRVRVAALGGEYGAVVLGVADDGALRVRNDAGETLLLNAGEVKICAEVKT